MLIDRSDDGLSLTGLIQSDELINLLGLYVRNAAGENWPKTAIKIQIEAQTRDKNRWPLQDAVLAVTVNVQHRGARRLALAAPAAPTEDDGA